jgi:hypothetical protein
MSYKKLPVMVDYTKSAFNLYLFFTLLYNLKVVPVREAKGLYSLSTCLISAYYFLKADQKPQG